VTSADDRIMSLPVEAETLDLSGPGIEEDEPAHRETQRSISDWANATFGPAPSNARIAARANEEMGELLRALTSDDNSPSAPIEAADVVIVLYRLCERMGVDLHSAIDAKMQINRARHWRVEGGHGQHVRDKEDDHG
jgi:NTP pyrophosphatase (non-canonical NTP hydrolase)